MLYNNAEMERMVASVAPLLDRRDLVGYAAARNTRALKDELTEYEAMRDRIVIENGTPELDERGLPTGRWSIDRSSERYAEASAQIDELAAVEHEPELMLLPYSAAIGSLNGHELLSAEWMFFDDSAVR